MNASQRKWTRRAILLGTAQAAAAGVILADQSSASPVEPQQDVVPAVASDPDDHVIWDAHVHLNTSLSSPRQSLEQLLRVADRMNIERVVVFMGYPWSYDPDPDEMRRQNDQVLAAIEPVGDRALAFVYLNPKHTRESLDELERCVGGGPMVGVKLWVALRCHDARLDPLVERAAQLKAPILQHTWDKITGNLPGESTAQDLATLAARHPDATFLAAHTGGDWETGMRAIRATPNVLAEVCGGDPTAGFVEMAVRELGAERVVYGSDAPGRSFASQLAKVLGAYVPESTKRLILAGNLQRVLSPICADKGISL